MCSTTLWARNVSSRWLGCARGTALSTALALPANCTRMAPPLTPPGRRLRRVTSAPTTLATSSRTSAGSSSGWVPWFMLPSQIRAVSVCELLVLSSVEASRVCGQSVEPHYLGHHHRHHPRHPRGPARRPRTDSDQPAPQPHSPAPAGELEQSPIAHLVDHDHESDWSSGSRARGALVSGLIDSLASRRNSRSR